MEGQSLSLHCFFHAKTAATIAVVIGIKGQTIIAPSRNTDLVIGITKRTEIDNRDQGIFGL